MESKPNTPLITLTKGGPLKISGKFTLTNEKNEQLESGDEIYLCRCGSSGKAPYCDGTHKKGTSSTSEEKASCD